MVVNQPTIPAVTTTVVRSTGDYYLTLSIVLTFICCFCGTWYSLFCTIPAIIMATSVSLQQVCVCTLGYSELGFTLGEIHNTL